MNLLSLPVVRRFDCDVAVVGGGTTGIAAAVASARNGARTVLVESRGFVGGNATAVSSYLGFHSREGILVSGGIALELHRRLRRCGGATAFYADPICGSVTVCNPDELKLVALEMLSEAGAELFLHCRCCAARCESGRVVAIYLLANEGIIEMTAKQVIDCTDSGSVLQAAGEKFIRGRADDGRMQVASTVFEVSGIDFDRTFDYWRRYPEDLRPFPLPDPGAQVRRAEQSEVFIIGAFRRLVAAARRDGMELPRDCVPGVAQHREGRLMTVAPRVENADSGRLDRYSRSEQEGYRQVRLWLKFLRDCVPGFETCRLSRTFDAIGLRETVHLCGRTVLTAEDLLAGRRFPDGIACGAYHMDIHSPDHDGIETRSPAIYTIPYGALLGRKNDNLLVAGRAISATHEAQSSTRVIPICMTLGETAGTAAAQAVGAGIPAAELPAEQLRAVLQKNGAILSPGAPDRELVGKQPVTESITV